jgi:hypothetical protein
MDIARKHLPGNSWVRSQLSANVNINENCNAFWNGNSINFYNSGGGCSNLGEISGELNVKICYFLLCYIFLPVELTPRTLALDPKPLRCHHS